MYSHLEESMRTARGETSAVMVDSPVEGVRVRTLLRTCCSRLPRCLATVHSCTVALVLMLLLRLPLLLLVVVSWAPQLLQVAETTPVMPIAHLHSTTPRL